MIALYFEVLKSLFCRFGNFYVSMVHIPENWSAFETMKNASKSSEHLHDP